MLPRFPHGDVGAVLDYGGLILDQRLGGLTQVSAARSGTMRWQN